MPKKQLTAYQRKIIQRYYQNRDAIDAQRLAELVTDLYLATSAKRKTQLWGRARKLLERIPDMDEAFLDRLEKDNDLWVVFNNCKLTDRQFWFALKVSP